MTGVTFRLGEILQEGVDFWLQESWDILIWDLLICCWLEQTVFCQEVRCSFGHVSKFPYRLTRNTLIDAALLAEFLKICVHFAQCLGHHLDCQNKLLGVCVVWCNCTHQRNGSLPPSFDLQVSAAFSSDANFGSGTFKNGFCVYAASADDHWDEIEVFVPFVQLHMAPQSRPTRQKRLAPLLRIRNLAGLPFSWTPALVICWVLLASKCLPAAVGCLPWTCRWWLPFAVPFAVLFPAPIAWRWLAIIYCQPWWLLCLLWRRS